MQALACRAICPQLFSIFLPKHSAGDGETTASEPLGCILTIPPDPMDFVARERQPQSAYVWDFDALVHSTHNLMPLHVL